MIHVAPVGQDTIVDVGLVTDSMSYLETHGYPVEIVELYSVVNQKPDDDNTGYIVAKIETLTKPFERADVVADSTEIYVCSCKAYRYQQGIQDLEEHHTLEWKPCKHIEPIDKHIKAANDQRQETLTGP